jgi:tRNA pseudouridine32 synthase/23S rRNA pseudouridine746 synthase
MRDGVSPSTVGLRPGTWLTVLDFLADQLPNLSKDAWAQRMQQGLVVTDALQAVDVAAPYAALLQAHTRLHYWRHVQGETPIPFEARVVYQDDWLVVADKPHFLPVVPSGQYVQETLLTRLKKSLGLPSLTPMHRLDRETAGLVAFTVQPQTRSAYQGLFRDRAVEKIYEAVAPWRAGDTWPNQVANHLRTGDHFMTMVASEGPVNAETHVQLLAHDASRQLGLYQLRPSTGQRHQLRVHMAGLGLPIVGDRIYPHLQPVCTVGSDYANPLQLVARSLSFENPITGQRHSFTSQMPLNWPDQMA